MSGRERGIVKGDITNEGQKSMALLWEQGHDTPKN